MAPIQTDSVLQLFFNHPTREFYLRELSRMTKLSPPAVKPRLESYLSKGIVKTVKRGSFLTWRANIESDVFKRLKAANTVDSITDSGILSHIEKRCHPDAIILFGSASRGEDTESSDVDIAVLGEESKLDLKLYESKLRRKISPLFIPNFNTISKELKNNLINGKILQGYLKVF